MTKILIQKSTGQILESYSGIIPDDETIIQNNSSIDASDLEIKTVSPEEYSKIEQDYLKKSKDGYLTLREREYPSWQAQMDLLYHGGVDALKAELKKTKDKFPKPS